MTELYTTNWSTIASINLSNFSGNWTFEEQEIDDSSYFEEATRFVSISVFILFGLIGIAGFVGNGLVVVGKSLIACTAHVTRNSLHTHTTQFKLHSAVVSANPQMRSTTNILIINLAVADLLFVIFCVPFTAADYIFDSWPFGDFWCRFVSSLPQLSYSICMLPEIEVMSTSQQGSDSRVEWQIVIKTNFVTR